MNLGARGIEVCTELLNFKALVLELLQFNTLVLEFLLELLYEQQKRGLVGHLCGRIRSGQVRSDQVRSDQVRSDQRSDS